MRRNQEFAVLGLGRFGRSIVRTLVDAGYSVMACDIDPISVHEVSQYATHVVQANLREESALAELGLGNFDVVIVAIGADLEANIMCTLIAKQSGVKYVLSKANNKHQQRILERIGADRVVLPEREMGIKVATNLINGNIIDFINFSDNFCIAEISPKDEWVGKTLQKANIRAQWGINIVAMKRGAKIIVSPKPDEVIQSDDILVSIGEYEDMQRLNYKGKEGGLLGFFQ